MIAADSSVGRGGGLTGDSVAAGSNLRLVRSIFSRPVMARRGKNHVYDVRFDAKEIQFNIISNILFPTSRIL